MDDVCYEPYEKVNERKEILKKGQYLLKSTCCSLGTCEQLIDDIQDTKYKCNYTFGKNFHDLDEKGNIIGVTLCSELNSKQLETLNFLKKLNKKAGKSKRKRRKIRRRTKRFRKI